MVDLAWKKKKIEKNHPLKVHGNLNNHLTDLDTLF